VPPVSGLGGTFELVAAGVAAPLRIVAAGVAVFFLAFTASEFTKMEPSAGSFVIYVETSLGPKAGVVTALLVAVGSPWRSPVCSHDGRRERGPGGNLNCAG
jgi:amino acid transporter